MTFVGAIPFLHSQMAKAMIYLLCFSEKMITQNTFFMSNEKWSDFKKDMKT